MRPLVPDEMLDAQRRLVPDLPPGLADHQRHLGVLPRAGAPDVATDEAPARQPAGVEDRLAPQHEPRAARAAVLVRGHAKPLLPPILPCEALAVGQRER